jgi:hypothetical protein
MLAKWAVLGVADVKRLSVVVYWTAPGYGPVPCSVVPQADMPLTTVPPIPALYWQLDPEPPVPARVATSSTVADEGVSEVKVFEVRSVMTPRLTVWSGVTRQEQHEINSSAGSKAYTLTHRFPVAVLVPKITGPSSGAPFAPVFVMLM